MARARSAILTYHSLDTSGSVISTDPAVFRAQMAWLATSGIPVVPLDTLPSTPGAIALTFDDGFRNFAAEALPVLERYRLPSTLFLVTRFCGRTNRWPGQPPSIPELPLLDWPELSEMRARGVSLGAHTATHPRLAGMPLEAAEREVRESQAAIEDRFGARVEAFAYPYGASTSAVRDVVRRQFRTACGTALRFVVDDDPADLPRIDAYYLRHPFWFERLMRPAGRAFIGARRLARDTRAWLFPSS